MSYAASLAALPDLEAAIVAAVATTQGARAALQAAHGDAVLWAAEDALRVAIAEEYAAAARLLALLASLGPLAQAEMDRAVASLA